MPIEQVANILSEDIRNKDTMYRIVRMKHSPSRSAKEQGADLANSFKSIKTYTSMINIKNEPLSVITNRIIDALESVKDVVRLKKSNTKKLTDFCGSISEILVRSNTSRGIRKGFLSTE